MSGIRNGTISLFFFYSLDTMVIHIRTSDTNKVCGEKKIILLSGKLIDCEMLENRIQKELNDNLNITLKRKL